MGRLQSLRGNGVSSLSEPINALMGDCLVLRVGLNNH